MPSAAMDWLQQTLALGDGALDLFTTGSDASHRLLVNLHRNETGSVEAATGLLTAGVGDVRVARFDAAPERLLALKFEGQAWHFDPNRIFSRVGIERTLHEKNEELPEVLVERLVTTVEAFATLLCAALRVDSAELVLALHNTGDDYCIHSYAEGGEESAWTEALHLGSGQHRHDFFLVTARAHFDALVARGYNVVFERLDDRLDDGSLSVYCARRAIPYINCEARYEAPEFQQTMLAAALEVCGP